MKSVCLPVYSTGTTERVDLFTYLIVDDGTLYKVVQILYNLLAFKIVAACFKKLTKFFFMNFTSITVDAVNTITPLERKVITPSKY